MKDHIAHYENKLNYETDSYDLWESITLGKDIVVVDARSAEGRALWCAVADRTPSSASPSS